MPRNSRRSRTLLAILLAAAAGAISLLSQVRAAGIERHASAPALTPHHLGLIQAALNITLPDGATLQHATYTHAKDSVFFAQISAPAASVDAWPGPPSPRFKPRDPKHSTGLSASPTLPWAPATPLPIRAAWSDAHDTTIEISAPDATGTVLIFLSRGGAAANFPPALRDIVLQN